MTTRAIDALMDAWDHLVDAATVLGCDLRGRSRRTVAERALLRALDELERAQMEAPLGIAPQGRVQRGEPLPWKEEER